MTYGGKVGLGATASVCGACCLMYYVLVDWWHWPLWTFPVIGVPAGVLLGGLAALAVQLVLTLRADPAEVRRYIEGYWKGR